MGQVALWGDELPVIGEKPVEASCGFVRNAVSAISILPGNLEDKKKSSMLSWLGNWTEGEICRSFGTSCLSSSL